MDALSLAANLIAVLNAASTTARGIQRLIRLQEVPEQVLQSQNEVSDTRILLTTVHQIVTESSSQDLNPRNVSHIQGLLDRALITLEKTSVIIDGGLSKYSDDSKRSKLSWRMWIKDRTKLDQQTNDLRQIRKEIAEALNMLTASEVPRVRMILHSISLGADSLRGQMSSLATIVQTSQSVLGTLHGVVKQLEASANIPQRKLALEALLRPHRTASSSCSTLRIHTAIQKQCRPLCTCICHTQSTISIPPWMSVLIGRLFIGYSSTPIFGGFSQKCTETRCQRNDTSTLKVDYYFPTWFLQRMITFRDQISPLDGHMISVRTPRVCGPSNTIFQVCQDGNIDRARALFSKGLASPFDVDFNGLTPLAAAVVVPSKNCAEMCLFLLNEYSDPEQENIQSLSPMDILWSFLLAEPSNSRLLQVKEVFSAFIDPGEGLRKRRFTSLHYSVLNLSTLDLEQQLIISTAKIEAKCSMGRTPLLWAVSVCNIEAAKTLLRYGASMQASDIYGHNVFHRVTARSSGGSPKLLSILIENFLENHARLMEAPAALDDRDNFHSHSEHSLKDILNFPEFEGSVPLLFAAMNNFAEQTQLLLKHGSETESPPESKNHPLLAAVFSNSHTAIEILLQWHARLDIVDVNDADGLLHLAAKYGNVTTMRILKEFGICCIDIEARNKDGMTPFQAFDEQRLLSIGEEEETVHHECREGFLRLLESVRPSSLNHSCWKNGWTTATEFIGIDNKKNEYANDNKNDMVNDNIQEVHNSEDEEEFFDALPHW